MTINDYVYQTHLPLNDCIERITSMPWEFDDVWSATPLWYKCQVISATRLLITFTGGQFRRFRRTEYLMDLVVKERITVIEMTFNKEMWGMPPMTTVQELDAFMGQKLLAKRTE